MAGEQSQAPFIVDESRTVWDEKTQAEKRYATFDSVYAAITDMATDPELADKKIKFPRDGKVHTGTVAEIATRECEVRHLAQNWPTGFQKYLAVLAMLPALPEA